MADVSKLRLPKAEALVLGEGASGAAPFGQGVHLNAPDDITVADGVLLTVSNLTSITGIASASHIVRSEFSNDRHYAFEISGAAGSLRAQGGIQLGTTTTLTLNNAVSYTGPAGGRLSDTAPLELTSAALSFGNTRSPAVDLSETIGALRMSGFSTLSLNSAPQVSGPGMTSLIADRLERLNRGSFEIIYEQTLGSGTTRAAYVRFTNAPATTAGGVVPYATAQIQSLSPLSGVVVYEAANGLRQLSAAEYTGTFTGLTSASHLLVASGTTLSNSATATIASLTIGTSATLAGSGLLNIASGLVLNQGGAAATVDNFLAFGSQEAFIAVPYDDDHEVNFLKPLTGSGGLTVYGRSLVVFSGGNQITGDLVLNGSARIRIGSMAELGPATTPIQVNGLETGAGVRTTTSLNFTRPVQVNSGYFSVLPVAGTVTLNGDITGSGGLFVRAGGGDVLLTGTNTYTGPTMVEGKLSFPSDAALGNSSSIILYNGTIKLLANWTTNRRLEPCNVIPSETFLDTNGFDADLQGNLIGTNSNQTLTKTGAGRLLVQAPLTNTSPLRVSGGQILVQGSGSLAAFRTNVTTGGTLLVDNTAGAVDRGTLNVTLGSGEYKILGHASQTTTIHGVLQPLDNPVASSTAYGVATFVPAGTAPILLDLTNHTYSFASYVVLRGGEVGGGPTGAFTRVRYSTIPTLISGLLPHLVLDPSATGYGSSFATYDTTSDASGVIGVRALKPAELTTTVQLANPANGGTTSTTANFLASGSVTVAGASTTLSTLTLAPGSRLDLGAGQRLNLSQNVLLVQPGAMAEIAGGVLAGSTNPVSIVGGGDLRLGGTIPAQTQLGHLGPGLLQITGRQTRSSIAMWSGTLQAGSGDPMFYSSVGVNDAAHFDLLGATTRIYGLNGTGTVNMGGGTLQVGGSGSTFSGQITGGGTFVSVTTSGVTLRGNSPFTGTLAAVNGVLTVAGTLPAIVGVTLKGGTLALDNAAAGTPAVRLGAVPLDLSGGLVNLIAASGSNTAATFGTLTGDGLNRLIITNDATGTASNEGRLTFDSLNRRGRGAFSFSTVLLGGRTGVFDFAQDLTPLLVGDASAATSRPVLPYALLEGYPVTFQPGLGLRRLTAAEQVSTLTAGQNVKISVDTTLNSTVAVNSAELRGILSGTGTLQVTSGLAVLDGPVQVILDFGTAEGHISVPDSTGNPQISGVIKGSNGLTISNFNSIALSGDNTFTGPLTINGARVTYKGLSSLGADSSPVVLAGGFLVYNAGSGTTYTLTRALNLQASGGHVVANTGYKVTATGQITGPGDLYLAGSVTLTNTTNSYLGTTFLAGAVTIGSDTVFGQSPRISPTQSSSIVLTGAWTTSRAVNLDSSSLSLDTAGFDAVLSGKLTGTSSFTKMGAGMVTISDAAEFTGIFQLLAGTVRLASGLGPSTVSSSVSVDVAGRLEGSSTFDRELALNGTLAPGVGASVGAFESGNLTMAGGSTFELQAISTSAFDQLRVNGTVTLNGLVQLLLGISGVTGSPAFQWPLLLNDGTDAITVSSTRAFSVNSTALLEGAMFNVNGFNAKITYKGGDGNDVYLTVPEPGCAALAVLGLLNLVARRPARRAPSGAARMEGLPY